MKSLLTTHHLGGTMLVEILVPRFDAAVASALTGWFEGQPPAPRTPVILDLGAVEFMDSSGLGAVVRLWRALGDQHAFSIAGLQPAVRTLLCTTRMDYVLPIFDDIEQALAA